MEHARPPSELILEGGPASRGEAWQKWLQQFNVFLKASGVAKESSDMKASLLVNLIGSEGYDVYTTFKFIKDENKECFDTLVRKFNAHFETKQNTTMARFKFFSRNQEEGESIDEYVTALKLLTQRCVFEHLEEGLVRDRIVCGVQDGKLRDRLLRADDLTLTRAVKICQANEMSTEEQKQIEGSKATGGQVVSVDAMNARGVRTGRSGARGTASAGRPCGGGGSAGGAGGARQPPRAMWRSGQQQRRGPESAASAAKPNMLCSACGIARCDGYKCAAKNAMCFWCNEIGHFKNMCPKLRKRVLQLDAGAGGAGAESDDGGIEDNDGLYYVSALSGTKERMDSKWYETLIFVGTGMKESFKLDSGSDLNVISVNTFQRLSLTENILNSDNTKAQSFCGNFIPIVGYCYLNCLYKSIKYKLRFVVADFDCQSVLGKYACEELGMVKRILSLNVDRYSDLFQGLGKLPGKYCIVVDKSAQPSVCPVRKIPIGVRDKLLLELVRMENMGVIRKVSHPTPWVNAIVVAAKKDGTIRVCLDPRPLNCVVRRAHYPLPTLTEIATKLEGAQYFSKLDARSGFWMVQLDDASADLCTFGTPFGRYQFLRLPYGINCASEVFHSKIRQILEDLDGVDSFIDDVIIWGSNKSQHDERLKKLLDRAREVGIKFNEEKCEFQVRKVSYLGHVFSAKGMSIDRSKVKAVEDMPVPKDRPSLERFLGMINYLSKFIANYSELALPLRNLLKKDTEWVWEAAQESAVRALQRAVCAAPVLALYSAREPVLLSVDASSRALGAVLLQAGRPVEFASATLTDTQCRYAQIEKELLAIVYGLERFHQYVYGRCDVTVESDHKPLEALFKKPLDSIPARLQRMMLRIQGYEFSVVYKPGKYMYVADALSRAALPELLTDKVSEEVEEQSCFLIENVRFSASKVDLIKDAMISDVECQLLIRYIQKGWPDNKYEVDERIRGQWSYRDSFGFVGGIIFKDNLVYIPKCVRTEMLNRLHDGHMGIDRCKRHAREVMFWPGMSRDVEAMVRRCRACAERAARPPREPLMPHHIPPLPWTKVGSDIFQYGGKYFLILVDYFSNFIEVNPLTNIGTRAVVTAMKDQFARHGVPQKLVTDNGPAYASKEFCEFSKMWDFEHITSSPNYAQSNGQSERSVQTIKNILIKSINSGSDFYLGLLNYRATPRNGISSPSELLMGRRLNTRLPSHVRKLIPSRDNDKDYNSMLRNQQKDKTYYDRRAKRLPELSPGQPVLITGEGKRKCARIIGHAAQPRSYFVADSSGRQFRRNRRHLLKLPANDNELAGPSSEHVSDDEETWLSPQGESDHDDDEKPQPTAEVITPTSPDALIQRPRSPSRRTAAVIARKKLLKN